MKFKYPKKLQVGNIIFTVKYDSKRLGGEFKYPKGKNDKAELILGTQWNKHTPLMFLETVIHELKEIIHTEMYNRYPAQDNGGEYLFSYNHKEHTQICNRLSELLDKFIV